MDGVGNAPRKIHSLFYSNDRSVNIAFTSLTLKCIIFVVHANQDKFIYILPEKKLNNLCFLSLF